jgi:hypothetical protein
MDDPRTPVPDGITPLTGYRLWKVQEREGEIVLGPVSSGSDDWAGAAQGWVSSTCPGFSEVWVSPSGELRWPDPHGAPDETCTCGFYAMKELTPELVLWAASPRGEVPGSADRMILGRVELAGKVIEHEFGYRAERARIVELTPIWGEEIQIRGLAERIGVPTGRPVDRCVAKELSPQQIPTERSPASMRRGAGSRDVGIWSEVFLVIGLLALVAAFATSPSDPESSAWQLVWIGCVVLRVVALTHRDATVSGRLRPGAGRWP